MDEVSVVAGEPKEFTDLGWVAGDGPVCNAFELFRIHLYSTVADDDTKVVDLFLFEVAFFGLEVKIVLF